MAHCAICKKEVDEREEAYYLLRGGENRYQENWDLILVVCEGCFAKRIFGLETKD